MSNHKILFGDIWASLSTLEDSSIDCVITSPPYWAQRDYGFQGQIGSENSLEEYIYKLVCIFRKLKSKLTPSGVFYLNLGDKYLSKYGNTPLGMIPYILAGELKNSGWILNEILIWYKPNHMPSSVKNRFTNTYEPIFVFSKSDENYFNIYKQKLGYTPILKVPLQPSQYKHMAAYPEKLVEELLKQNLPNHATILDPFAGSGTTCKAVQNFSDGYFNPIKMKSISIEANPDFIKIMRNRCMISELDVKKIKYVSYEYPRPCAPLMKEKKYKSESIDEEIKLNFSQGSLIIQICQNDTELRSLLNLIRNNTIDQLLNDDGVLFIALPDHFLINILKLIEGVKEKWIIRNMLVIPQGKTWIPIFMLVKDIKSVKYKFNLDTIRVAHKYSQEVTWTSKDFLGYRVEKSQIVFKNSCVGFVLDIISRYKNGLPHFLAVKWNGNVTVEEVISYESNTRQILMRCPRCNITLKKYYHYKNPIHCNSCDLLLWQDISSIPILVETTPKSVPNYIATSKDFNKFESMVSQQENSKYDGKFKGSSRINIGQSPGARASLNEEFFSFKRYHVVYQPMVSDYLNLHRRKMDLTKNALTALFPPEYTHTCGHWLRKDRGGSLPKIEDLNLLNSILDLDESYVNYINRVGLRLQTVIADVRGKNPGDFLDLPLNEVIKILSQIHD